MVLAALFGAHPNLSAAEWEAQGVPVTTFAGRGILKIATEAEAKTVFARLGGTHRLLTLVAPLKTVTTATVSEALTADLKTRSGNGKQSFCLSADGIYSLPRDLPMQIKKHLRSEGLSARAIELRSELLPGVALHEHHLLDRGGEYHVTRIGEQEGLWRTIAVHDIVAWGQRDFGRPRRNAKQGMLPPKLARIMLNLMGTVKGKTILDPFCGSGTILTEAHDLGAAALFGSDLSPMAVADTKANLTWAKGSAELATGDVRVLARLFPSLQVDAIVSETHLGSPKTGREKTDDLKNELTTIADLYKDAAPELSARLKVGGYLIICVPEYRTAHGSETIETQSLFEKEKLVRVLSRHEPLLYHHEGQFVARRIEVYKKHG